MTYHIEEADSRVSYDFYRLLQTNDIHITYNSSPDGIDSGEKADFIPAKLLGNKKYDIQKFVSTFPLSDSLFKMMNIQIRITYRRLDEISNLDFPHLL